MGFPQGLVKREAHGGVTPQKGNCPNGCIAFAGKEEDDEEAI